MSTRNPSTALAEAIAEFSKSAFTALAEATAERDNAIKDLELECQSWKQEAAGSKAAIIQAELTIAHQAETLAKQVEVIGQLRREVNQWIDQSRNWQEHFVRVEQERCADSSRMDEIIEKLNQYTHPLSTSSLIAQTISKYPNHVDSSTSAGPQDLSASLQAPNIKHDLAQNHAHRARPQPKAAPIVDPSASVPPLGFEQQKPNFPDTQERDTERHRQLDGTRVSTGRKERNGDGARKYTAVVPQHQPTPPRSVKPDGPIQSTVIRRVQAIIHVKREDDQTDEDAEALQTSAPSASGSTSGVGKMVVRKRKIEDPFAEKAQLHRRRDSRKTTAIISDEDDDTDGLPFQHSAKGGDSAYKLRKPPKVDYREDLDEEEDELMMGAEDNHDEVYGTHPVEPSRQQQSPKKRRKYSAR